jgi:hypothetical protein
MLSAVRGTVTAANEDSITDIPDAAFRWDASGQQWIFNMATSNITSGELRENPDFAAEYLKAALER